jgi:hypothetical protein
VSARASSADHVVTLLRECDPVKEGRVASPQVERALDTLAARIVLTAPTKERRRLSRRWKLAIVALAAAAIITGVASAAGVSARARACTRHRRRSRPAGRGRS